LKKGTEKIALRWNFRNCLNRSAYNSERKMPDTVPLPEVGKGNAMKSIRMTLTGVLAALLLTATVTAVPSFAQDKMGSKMSGDKMAGKMTHPIYVSKGMKMGYSEADAKKMGMKDKMGKMLTKMTVLPKGYKMAGKMDDKMGSKMSGGKMDDKMGGKMTDKP